MKNAGIVIVIIIMCISLIIYCVRTQFLIDDEQFLNGMIPHHSMAILMAQNIKKKTTNKEIKKLADNIIDTQTKEIELMDSILRDKKMNNVSTW
jgi:Na+-transporting NADH:ubiquinone oxidoreductase subunit NqrC